MSKNRKSYTINYATVTSQLESMRCDRLSSRPNVFLPARVLINLRVSVQGRPLRLLLEEPHRLDVL